MKANFLLLAGVTIALQPNVSAANPNSYCRLLQNFIKSIAPDGYKIIEFHTIWGGNFKGDGEKVLYAKRCDHGGFKPAKNVCGYLLNNASVEFAGRNFMNSISCLSPKSKFSPELVLKSGNATITLGTDSKGSLIYINLGEDTDIGGMNLKIEVDNY